MIERRALYTLGLLALGGLFAAAAGCGLTASSGDSGSETHWLTDCASDDDCSIGQCWCGVCSERCQVALDCPEPLDTCSASGEGGEAACEFPICHGSAPGEISAAFEREQRNDVCEAGRPTSLFFLKDREGAMRVAANGELGFFVWSSFFERGNLLRLNAAGRVMRRHSPPSELSPLFDELTALGDGSTLLTGSVTDFDGTHGWLGKVDPSWSLIWERELADPDADLINSVPLDDGSVVVAYQRQVPPLEQEGSRAMEAYWARVASSGELVWERRVPFTTKSIASGWGERRMLALTDSGELRIALNTEQGLKLIFGTLDGDSEEHAIETSFTPVRQISALSGDRLALIASGTAVATLDAAGNLLWERDYAVPDAKGRLPTLEGFTYNRGREELVMIGSWGAMPAAPREVPRGGGGTWMLATNLDGEPTWQLSREPIEAVPIGTVPSGFTPTQGPALLDVAATPDGSLLAVGALDEALVYLTVGAGSCGPD